MVEAERSSESKKKEALVEAKEEIHKLRSELEREIKERRLELQRLERRLMGSPLNLSVRITCLKRMNGSKGNNRIKKPRQPLSKIKCCLGFLVWIFY